MNEIKQQLNVINIMKIFLIVLFVIIVSISLYWVQQEKVSPILIQQCPDRWYQNRMPGIAPTNLERLFFRLGLKQGKPREYFDVAGKRRELSEFDVDWVRANCSVRPSEVW